MAAYHLEDIDLIRKAGNLSYRDAVDLLEYHNGSVTAALRDAKARRQSAPGEKRGGAQDAQPSLWRRLYSTRVIIQKGKVPVANVSSLYVGATVLLAPWLAVGSGAAALLLGYRFSLRKRDPAFLEEDPTEMVRSTIAKVSQFGEELANTANSAWKNVGAEQNPAAPKPQSRPARPSKESVPTIHFPVQVDSQETSVQFEDDGDGFTSATLQ